MHLIQRKEKDKKLKAMKYSADWDAFRPQYTSESSVLSKYFKAQTQTAEENKKCCCVYTLLAC